jgi:hypothetical protein
LWKHQQLANIFREKVSNTGGVGAQIISGYFEEIN